MKKNIFSLILIFNIANLFAYDQQIYKALLAGSKRFENVDLSKARIENMDLSDVTFVNVNLVGALFNNSMLTNVTFDSCNLSNSTFYDVIFNNSKFLNNSNLTSCIFAKVIFDASEINDSIMAEAKLLGTDFMSSRIYNVNMYNARWKTVNFSACVLENIDLKTAQLEFINIYDTAQICSGFIFDQTIFSHSCFLGRKERSSIIASNFYGTIMLKCYFVNLNFDNCTNLNQVGSAEKSLFDNISTINPKDLDIFAKKLKDNGARVNGDWTTNKEYWDKFDSHELEKFFAQLWPNLAGLAGGAAVGFFFPPASVPAAAAARATAAAYLNK